MDSHPGNEAPRTYKASDRRTSYRSFFKRFHLSFYDLNCNSDIDKKDLFCTSDDTINQYIFRSLCRYKEELHNYNRSETIYDLMQRTPPAERSIGYLIPVNTAS